MPAITTGTTAVRPLRFCVALTTTLVCLVVWSPKSTAAEKVPVSAPAASPRLFEQHGAAAPLDADAYITPQPKVVPRQVNFQPPASGTPRPIKPLIVESPEAIPAPAAQDPCGEVTEKPLGQLGINIAIPAGESTDRLWVRLPGIFEYARRPQLSHVSTTNGMRPACAIARCISKRSTWSATVTVAAAACSRWPRRRTSSAPCRRCLTAWPPNARTSASTRSAITVPAAAHRGVVTGRPPTRSPQRPKAAFGQD